MRGTLYKALTIASPGHRELITILSCDDETSPTAGREHYMSIVKEVEVLTEQCILNISMNKHDDPFPM